MELRNERAEFFEESDADGFEVRLGFAGVILITRVAAGDTLEILVEAHWLRVGGHAPLGGAEEDADVRGVEFDKARRDAAGFDGMIDGGEDDVAVAGDVNDDAAAGEIGDDFVFALLVLGARRQEQHRKGGEEEEGVETQTTHNLSIVNPFWRNRYW